MGTWLKLWVDDPSSSFHVAACPLGSPGSSELSSPQASLACGPTVGFRLLPCLVDPLCFCTNPRFPLGKPWQLPQMKGTHLLLPQHFLPNPRRLPFLSLLYSEISVFYHLETLAVLTTINILRCFSLEVIAVFDGITKFHLTQDMYCSFSFTLEKQCDDHIPKYLYISYTT